MIVKKLPYKIGSLSQLLLQLAILFAFWYVGYFISNYFNLSLSAGVTGLFLMLFALLLGVMKLSWVRTGAHWALGHLVLLFVPCVIGLMNYKTLLLTDGWKLIIAIVIGTAIVMIVTGYSVKFGFLCEEKLKAYLKKQGRP